MNGNQRLRRLARSGWGIVGGVIAIGAAAAAAGAAPSTLTPWSSNEPAATTSTAPAVTIPHEQVTNGHPSTVVTLEPATTAPATTSPATTAPATTAPASSELATTAPTTEPASTEPASTPPSTPPAPPAPTTPPSADAGSAGSGSTGHEPAPVTPKVPPTTAAPEPTPEPAPPAPAPSPAPPVSDNVVPAGLLLSCNPSSTESGFNVSCEWSGPIPAGFAKFVLLRGNQGTNGRVPFQSGDPSAHAFVDMALAPGTYTYVLVALDAAGKPLVHSNMVPISSPG